MNVQREKQTFCGAEYKEIDIYTANTNKAMGRSPRRCATPPKQQNLNDKNARRYLVQLINTNFRDNTDYLLHLTYDNNNLPATIEEAERNCRNFIRRLNYLLQKQAKENCRYIIVTSDTSTKTGKPIRIHHHIILSCDLSEKEILKNWNYGRRNLNELQGREDKYNKLVEYLKKNTGGKKRWVSSRGLKKPKVQTNDRKFTRRQIEKIAKAPPDLELWERIYKGWELIKSENAFECTYNDLMGWHISLKLMKKKAVNLNCYNKKERQAQNLTAQKCKQR